MIFGVVSQKGGVGKTTLTQNLGAELSGLGKRVLLIDFDPKGNLSTGWGINLHKIGSTISEVLQSPKEFENGIVRLRPKLDLIPADDRLAVKKVSELKKLLDLLKDAYDIILIDSAPCEGLLLKNVIEAANHLLVPLQVHPFAYRAADRLVTGLEQAESAKHRKPVGVILTMVDQRNSLTKAIEHSARERFGQNLFKSKIPRNVDIAEAPLSGLPVSEYERMSKGAKAFRSLAKEVKNIYG